VAVEGGLENSKGDFTGIATSPARVIPQSIEEVRVENPVNHPETVSSSNQEVTAGRPETVAANAQQTPAVQPETRATPQQSTPVTAASPAIQNAPAAGNTNVATPMSRSDTPTPQQSVQSQSGAVATTQQDTPAIPPPSLGLLELISASASAAVNPENVRDVNALVNSVVENEFTAEAKKIFSQPKIIRTVADLADFILERLREIFLTKQLQKQSPSTGES
jgi:hypothetical protein